MNRKRIGQLLWVLLFAAIVPNACAQVDNSTSSSVMHQKEAPQNTAAPITPEIVYPYPPEALWQRLLQVAKTPPAELTISKIEEIFDVKFDDAKPLLWGDEEEIQQKKYFSSSKQDLQANPHFPFMTLHTTQFQERAGPGTRDLIFRFEVFDPMLDRAMLAARSTNYCVQPVAADLEALGHRYSKLASMTAAHLDRGIHRHRRDYYMRDEELPMHVDKSIILTLLPNGCLNGFEFKRTNY